MNGKVVSINVSDKKGIRKKPISEAEILTDFGIKGDAHASQRWHRQISILALESIKKMQVLGLKVTAGDFAENITTEGIDLLGLPVGTQMSIGNVELEVSQIKRIIKTHMKTIFFNRVCQIAANVTMRAKINTVPVPALGAGP